MQFQQITSRDNPKIKEAAKLAKTPKYRREKGLITCEGKKLCTEMLMENLPICTVFFTDEAYNKEKVLIHELAKQADEIYLVSSSVMEKISATKTPQGIFAICKPSKKMQENSTLQAIKTEGRYLCLQKIADPGNMGTMIRTAAALGLDGLIITRDCTDVYGEKVVRSAMGSVFKIPIITVDDMAQCVVYLKECRIHVFAAALREDSVLPTEIGKAQGGIAVMIGNEANGLTDEVIALADKTVMIPMQNEVESLNAAVAATICMWEMTR